MGTGRLVAGQNRAVRAAEYLPLVDRQEFHFTRSLGREFLRECPVSNEICVANPFATATLSSGGAIANVDFLWGDIPSFGGVIHEQFPHGCGGLANAGNRSRRGATAGGHAVVGCQAGVGEHDLHFRKRHA